MPGKVSSPNEKSKNESPSIKVPSSSRKTMKFHDAVPGETTRDQLRNLPKWKSPLRTVDNSVDFDFYEYFQVTPTGKQRMGYRKYEQMKNLAEKGALSHEQAKKWEIMRDPLGLNGVTLLYYDGIAPWEKVVIQVQEGLVWNIDAFPPAGTTVEEIENSALDLREPMVDREDALDVEPGREVIAKESQAERILPFYTPQGLRVGPVSFPSQLRYVEYGNRRVGLFYHPRRNSFDPGNRSVGEVRMVRFFADVPERYPILGISLQKISSTGSFPKSFQREEHVAVTAIIGDSSAEKAGFQVDDILLSVNGREAKDVQQTRRLVLDCPIDSPSEFLILRDKEMRTIHTAPIIQPIPQAYSRRCGFFLEHQAPEAAIRDANVVLEIEPENVPMLVNRAVGYEACKDHERAEADLDRAVELDDTFAPAYANRGLLSEKRGENAQALEDYSKALRLAPNYRFAYRGRARLYRKLGEIEKAAEDEAILQKLEAENAGL
jgi:Tfp pilus assembly protein PilF